MCNGRITIIIVLVVLKRIAFFINNIILLVYRRAKLLTSKIHTYTIRYIRVSIFVINMLCKFCLSFHRSKYTADACVNYILLCVQ